MMSFLYNVFFLFFALAYLPVFATKGKFGKGFAARFGSVPPQVREALAGTRPVWVHAVSVGEMGLAVSLVNRLRERMPLAKFLLTTTTKAGYTVASKIKNEEDALTYFPIDFPWSVDAFLRGTDPCLLVLLETEIWPNVIRKLSKKGIPVVIANGRISDRAFGRYLGARFFLKRLFRRMEGISAQDERMRSRFIALGASPEQVAVNGNLKYDWEPSPFQEGATAGLKRVLRQPAWSLMIAGSTHEGEEEHLFRIYPRVRRQFPRARLLVAPRHLERMAAVEKAAERAGLRARRVTTSSYASLSEDAPNDVWLLDQVGVLALLFECAELVFLGGSLVPVGGHNLAEPAYYARPVLFGPHMQNFSQMAQEFKSQRAGLQVADAAGLEKEWENALNDPSAAAAVGRASRDLVRRHQGATQKNVDWILSYADSKERSFAKV